MLSLSHGKRHNNSRIMDGYTHIAEIYGFRCYYNDDTGEVKGTNWFNEKMIDLFVWIDVTFEVNDGFYIKIIQQL